MESFIIPAAQLGTGVFTTIAFLWYLERNSKQQTKISEKRIDADIILAKALQRLTDMVERSLDKSSENTSQLGKNETALKDNTKKVEKNSEVIATNGEH